MAVVSSCCETYNYTNKTLIFGLAPPVRARGGPAEEMGLRQVIMTQINRAKFVPLDERQKETKESIDAWS